MPNSYGNFDHPLVSSITEVRKMICWLLGELSLCSLLDLLVTIRLNLFAVHSPLDMYYVTGVEGQESVGGLYQVLSSHKTTLFPSSPTSTSTTVEECL